MEREYLTKRVLDKAVKLRLQGYGLAEVMASLELTHSQVEDACYLFVWHYVLGQQAIELTPEGCAALRYYYGLSWGHIGAMGGQTDPKLPVIGTKRYNAIRRMSEEWTGIASVANRNGKGGRYYLGDPELYADNLKATGTVVSVDMLPEVRNVAQVQRYMAKGLKELRALADERGITYAKSSTPARLAKLLCQADA